jgi:hypothetical protein
MVDQHLNIGSTQQCWDPLCCPLVYFGLHGHQTKMCTVGVGGESLSYFRLSHESFLLIQTPETIFIKQLLTPSLPRDRSNPGRRSIWLGLPGHIRKSLTSSNPTFPDAIQDICNNLPRQCLSSRERCFSSCCQWHPSVRLWRRIPAVHNTDVSETGRSLGWKRVCVCFIVVDACPVDLLLEGEGAESEELL